MSSKKNQENLYNVKKQEKKIMFAENLKELRTDKGLSLEQMGQLIGVSDTAILNWEQNKNEPKLSYLIKIADLYEISLDELVGRESLETGVNVHTQLTRQQQALLLIFEDRGFFLAQSQFLNISKACL